MGSDAVELGSRESHPLTEGDVQTVSVLGVQSLGKGGEPRDIYTEDRHPLALSPRGLREVRTLSARCLGAYDWGRAKQAGTAAAAMKGCPCCWQNLLAGGLPTPQLVHTCSSCRPRSLQEITPLVVVVSTPWAPLT
jgi:hypothetical protein